jgi:hypothetical protein
MVLDNTVGGFLNLSIRRIVGTVVGGVAAMVGMTIIRVIFSTWNIGADFVLASYFFVQVFCIAKLKHRPALSNACSIVSPPFSFFSFFSHTLYQFDRDC